MDRDASYADIPRLSDEAINLFFERGGFVQPEPVVDLRSLWKSEPSEAITRAAKAWGRSPDEIVVL